MPQAWPSDKGNGSNSDILKIEAGKPKLVHVMSETPWEIRSAFHSVLKKAIVLPVGHNRIEGERTRYAFIVYDFEDKKVKSWFVSMTLAGILRAAQIAWGGTFEKMDVQIVREGTGFNDTKYAASPIPTKFTDSFVIGSPVPDMEKLTAASLPADIIMHVNTPDPQLEVRRLEKEAKDSTPRQRKFLEDKIDSKKITRADFASMLETADADKQEEGKFLPKKLTVGQASKLIDMVKEF